MTPEIDVEGRWYRRRDTQACMAPMTLGGALVLLRGESWSCACCGPPLCCVDRYVHARIMRRAAHIAARQLSDLAARRTGERTGCECGHEPEKHDGRGGQGRCRGLDSYGCPCECPSYVEIQHDYDDA